MYIVCYIDQSSRLVRSNLSVKLLGNTPLVVDYGREIQDIKIGAKDIILGLGVKHAVLPNVAFLVQEGIFPILSYRQGCQYSESRSCSLLLQPQPVPRDAEFSIPSRPAIGAFSCLSVTPKSKAENQHLWSIGSVTSKISLLKNETRGTQ
jgi:hypothetical protein